MLPCWSRIGVTVGTSDGSMVMLISCWLRMHVRMSLMKVVHLACAASTILLSHWLYVPLLKSFISSCPCISVMVDLKSGLLLFLFLALPPRPVACCWPSPLPEVGRGWCWLSLLLLAELDMMEYAKVVLKTNVFVEVNVGNNHYS